MMALEEKVRGSQKPLRFILWMNNECLCKHIFPPASMANETSVGLVPSLQMLGHITSFSLASFWFCSSALTKQAIQVTLSSVKL